MADLRGAGPQRERGPEYVIVLVSEHFDGVPWLERVYVAGTLWDTLEMGAPTDVHCYTPAEFERARAYSAGRRVLAFENTNAVARYAANQTVVFGEDIDPDQAIAALDETTLERVTEVARGISVEASVACVGPHEAAEFA